MKFTVPILVAAVCLVFFASSAEAQTPLWGVAYGVDYTNCPTYNQIYDDLKIIKSYTNRVRIYACFYCNNVCYNVTKASQEIGLEVLIGLQPAPANEFAWELLMLQQIHDTIGFGGVKGITVGSETIFRKDMTTAELAAVINETRVFLRNLGNTLPVGTADIHNYFDQVLTDACDEIYINSFPYWIGIQPIDVALQAMFDHYDVAVTKAKGKPVIWGEMGWPTKGPNVGASEATPAQLEAFLMPFACEARLRNQHYYWFAAFDRDSTKGDAENNWGLYTSDRKRKPAFKNFDCSNYVSQVTTPMDRTKPADWKNSLTRDADYDGKGIKTSGPQLTSATLAPTTNAPTTAAPTSTSATSTTVIPTSQVTSTSVISESSVQDSAGPSNTNDEITGSGSGRQQTTAGAASVFYSAALVFAAALLVAF